MRKVSAGFSKVMDGLEKVLRLLIGVAMFVMLIVMTYQVILRYVFNASNIWSEELARYLMCYTVLLGASIAVRKCSHLQVDFMLNLLKPRLRCIAVCICTAAGAVFLGYFLNYGLQLCVSTMNSISSGTGVPMGYVYACLPIGAVLMILASIEVILKELTKFVELGKEKEVQG